AGSCSTIETRGHAFHPSGRLVRTDCTSNAVSIPTPTLSSEEDCEVPGPGKKPVVFEDHGFLMPPAVALARARPGTSQSSGPERSDPAGRPGKSVPSVPKCSNLFHSPGATVGGGGPGMALGVALPLLLMCNSREVARGRPSQPPEHQGQKNSE